MPSKIEWTDESWPVVTGCSPVSKGCMNCWAARNAAGRLRHHKHYKDLTCPWDPPTWTGDVRVNKDVFDRPLKWRKPRKVFVAPTGDLFHKSVAGGWITSIFEIMAKSPKHTFQVLTKRPERMASFVRTWRDLGHQPLGNVWLGVSVEDQRTGEQRLPILEDITWPIKWASLEPLLGSIDPYMLVDVDWIVIGGESGKLARPMHPHWVARIINTWQGRTPIFFKQWGEWLPWGPGDYTRCFLTLHGTQLPFDTGGPPPGQDTVVMTRVGKKLAKASYHGLTFEEWPEVIE